VDKKHRVLIISNRTLVAHGLVSLLENLQQIEEITIAESLYAARQLIRINVPDTLVIDLPPGADYFIDRPMEIDGQEIKTIVVQDDGVTGQARMYVYNPAVPANIRNLALAIFSGPTGERRKSVETKPPVMVTPQPTSLIKASESGPSSLKISSSRAGL